MHEDIYSADAAAMAAAAVMAAAVADSKGLAEWRSVRELWLRENTSKLCSANILVITL